MKGKKGSRSLRLECPYFCWRLGQRKASGVWYADGRSNRIDIGRHSLGTRDLEQAKKLTFELDIAKAVEFGLGHPQLLKHNRSDFLEVEAGVNIFLSHLDRPDVAGGPKESTRKRYRRIIRAFESYAQRRKRMYWDHVDADFLNAYAEERRRTCTLSSVVTELVLIRAIHKHLVDNRFLDDSCRLPYRIRRTKESTMYCPTTEEVNAIETELSERPSLQWLRSAVSMLAQTGLRHGELAQLTWCDIDFGNQLLHVRHESERGGTKSTKTGYSRVVPMNKKVITVLNEIPVDRTGPLMQGPRGGTLRCDTFGNNLRQYALVPLAGRFPHAGFQRITAHCFRHYFASLCAAAGAPQQVVMDWMGHRTTGMAKRYFHRNDHASARHMAKVEAFLDLSLERSNDNPPAPEQPDRNVLDTEKECEEDT